MEGGAFDAVGLSLGDRATSYVIEQEALAKLRLEVDLMAGKEQAKAKREAALAKPPPPRTPATPELTQVAAPLSEEVLELQGKGEDPFALGALGRKDRAALKAKLRELGYKSMRARVKMEEELIALPSK